MEIIINGITLCENISNYSKNAVLANNDHVAIDQPLDIEIAHVQAIRIYNSSQQIYNNSIAFLIRTRDGKILLHTRLGVSMTLATPNLVDLSIALLASKRIISIDGATSNAPIVLDFDTAKSSESFAQALGSTQTSTSFVWSTLQLQDDMLHENQMTIPLFITCSYNVVEESSYEDMRLISGSKGLR